MIRLIYNLLFPFALLIFLPGYILKMLRRGNYRNKFGQRLGFYDLQTRKRLSQARPTWLHAVSVGEVMIALKLAARMKEREPALRVALTTTTTTGFALATRRVATGSDNPGPANNASTATGIIAPGYSKPPWIEVLYTPLDFWPIMRRAFRAIRPDRIVLVEAEVWPNLTAIAYGKKIPLALVNARLSPRSEARFRKFSRLVRPYFQKLDLVCVQEPEDGTRWESLGANRDRIHPVGSIKFDPENVAPNPAGPRAALEQLGIDATRRILLAGSTHRGEEEILGKLLLELRREFSDLFLVIAPRHAERALEIASRLRAIGLPTVRRSEGAPATMPDCLLLDTTGELRDWYAVATIVFIGKSLVARGGQNPVEAIVAHRPVVFGPNMENFARLAEVLVARGGAFQPRDAVSLTKVLADLLADPEKRERLARNAHQVLDQHRGATDRTVQLLENLAAHPS